MSRTPVKTVPITRSDPSSGKQMFKDYCAACHGMDGKGNGPATEFLKAPPPDLTTMAKRNDGKFPESKFATILRFGTSAHPHGNGSATRAKKSTRPFQIKQVG